MAKLIVSTDGEIVDEYPMDHDILTIGRHEDNDITIDCMSISGFHSRVVAIGSDFFIEDLKSTNGSYVNSDQVKMSQIRDADIITLGSHNLKFQDVHAEEDDEFETAFNGQAQLIVRGENANPIELNGGMVTFGKTGEHVAAVTKRGDDYYCLHVDGGKQQSNTLLNGKAVPTEGSQLKSHDVVEVAGIEMEFIN